MFLIIVCSLFILGIAFFYGMMLWYNALTFDVWWAHLMLIAIFIVCVCALLWKLEDEFFLFSNLAKKKDEGRSTVHREIKYKKPYKTVGVSEKFNEYEWARYLLSNQKQGGRDLIIRLAKEGFAPAQALYGYALLFGEYGFPKEQKIGITWLKEAEEQDCPVAYAFLFYAYKDGLGVRKSERKAKEYLQKSLKDYPIPEGYLVNGYEALDEGNIPLAEEYFRKAYYANDNYGLEDLGYIKLLKPLSKEQAEACRVTLSKAVTTSRCLYLIARTYEWQEKYKLSAKYLEASAEQGYKPAQRDFALYLLNGIGVQKDTARAERLYLSLAKTGDEEACVKLGKCYAQGYFGEIDEEKAEYYHKKATESGKSEYLYHLAEYYRYSVHDSKKACAVYKQGAEAGNGLCQTGYGECLLLQSKDKQALEWLLKGAEQGDNYSTYRLGMYYSERKEYTKAFSWLLKSADDGNDMAQVEVAVAYGKGEGVKADWKKSFAYMQKSAEANNWRGQFYLSGYYEEGLGVEKNQKLADYWKAKAESNTQNMY